MSSEALPRLAPSQLRNLRRYGALHRVRVGEVLVQTGAVATDLFVLGTASVQVVRERTLTRPEVEVAHFGPGDFLGEMSLLIGQRSMLTARVVGEGTVFRVGAKSLRRLIAEAPDLGQVILGAFSARRQHLLEAASDCIEVVGSTDATGDLLLRTYLVRMSMPHRWYESGSSEGQALCSAAGLEGRDLPAVFRGQEHLSRATPERLARWTGLAEIPIAPTEVVDVAVIGAGPAGLAAAIGCASEGLTTVVLDATGPGGQAGMSSRIENYLGFPGGLSGHELATRAALQALKFGARLVAPIPAVEITSETGPLRLQCGTGEVVHARTVVLATGVRYRPLGIPGERELLGAGLYLAATKVEGDLCRGRSCVVVGGANSAGQAALFLAGRGSSVTLVVRGADVRAGMSSYLADRVEAHANVQVLLSSTVRAIERAGTDLRVHITCTDGREEGRTAAAVFSMIGGTPCTDAFSGARDPEGYVLTGPVSRRYPGGGDVLPYETSVANVFAVGDVRAGSLKRVAAAAGEGASVVASIHRALARQAADADLIADPSTRRASTLTRL